MELNSQSPSKGNGSGGLVRAEVGVAAGAPSHSAKPAVAINDSRSAGALRHELHGRRYHARWAHPGTIETLRVNVRVDSATNGSGRFHVETLDLYSPRSRRVFASKAAKLLGVEADTIDQDLSEILVAVDRAQRDAIAAAHAEAALDAKPKMVQ